MLTENAWGLSARDYELFRGLIYEKSGINLGPKKQQLLRARLGKRLRGSQFSSFREYYEHVRRDASGAELCVLIDAISTNTTHLFREKQHFDFLTRTLRGLLEDRRWRATNHNLRIWSAGCSTGDEPYSLAMTVDHALAHSGLDWKILATDISTRVLERARRGLYELTRLGTVPADFRLRYFVPADGCDGTHMQVSPTLRKQITFAHFNLMTERFPFRHGFHCIFCRNVMIYFDRPTQEKLVARFAAQLRAAGYLVIGHSESLNSIRHSLEYVQPTIYRKADA